MRPLDKTRVLSGSLEPESTLVIARSPDRKTRASVTRVWASMRGADITVGVITVPICSPAEDLRVIHRVHSVEHLPQRADGSTARGRARSAHRPGQRGSCSQNN